MFGNVATTELPEICESSYGSSMKKSSIDKKQEISDINLGASTDVVVERVDFWNNDSSLEKELRASEITDPKGKE